MIVGNTSAGFNVNDYMNPIEFYNTIMRNIDKFSDQDEFIILRFFDKLVDSRNFAQICKDKLSTHIEKKNISEVSKSIFSDHPKEVKLSNGCYLKPKVTDNSVIWNFVLGGCTILDNISSEDAIKICKDVNTAFSLRRLRRTEYNKLK